MKRLGAYILLAVSFVAKSASADEIAFPWYAGVGLDVVNFSVNKGSVPSLTPTSSVDSTSYNPNFLLGYQFDSFLGTELGYLGGGSVTSTDNGQTTQLFKVDLMTLAATMGAPVNDNVRLYAKLGGTSWKFSSWQNGNKNDGFGPCIGIGADINLYGDLDRTMRIEYIHYRLDNVYVKSASNLSINAIFHFK